MGERVNTMMAGMKGTARSARGKYTAAGYTGRQERQLYIAQVPAGSAQDDLIDLNKRGYRSDRPWNETPVFESEPVRASVPRTYARKKKETMADALAYYARREKKDVAVCIALAALIIVMCVAWTQKLVAGVELQQAIAQYQTNTHALQDANEALEKKLEEARSGERIRELARNTLNMERPERANTETIFIQRPENLANKTLQQNEEPRMEWLDILLGLLNVFHIGE